MNTRFFAGLTEMKSFVDVKDSKEVSKEAK